MSNVVLEGRLPKRLIGVTAADVGELFADCGKATEWIRLNDNS